MEWSFLAFAIVYPADILRVASLPGSAAVCGPELSEGAEGASDTKWDPSGPLQVPHPKQYPHMPEVEVMIR